MKMPNDPDDNGEEKLVTKEEQAKLESKPKSSDADTKEKKDDKKEDVVEKTPADEKTDPGEESTAPEPAQMDPANRPLGSQILKSMHSGLKSLYKMGKSSAGPQLEHEAVKGDVLSHCDQMKCMMKSLEASHARNYSQFKSDLDSDDADEGGGDDDSDMKSLLANSAMYSGTIGGVTARLKSLLTSKNLTKEERLLVTSNCKFLDKLDGDVQKMISQKKSMAAQAQATAATNTANEAQKKKLEELAAKFQPAKS